MKKYYSKTVHGRTNRSGFTLVELSLSVLFIAILSIAVVLVMTGAISSYHRSITLNKLNNVGSSLVRDMQDAIKNASVKTMKSLCEDNFDSNNNNRTKCLNDNGKKLNAITRYANVKARTRGEVINSVPVFGAVCLGSYSYIWNSGYFFNDDYDVDGVGPVKLTYELKGEGAKTVSNFRLIKIKDELHKVCKAALRNYASSGESDKYKYDLTNIGGSGDDVVFNMAEEGVSTDEAPVRFLGSDKQNDEEGSVENDDGTLAIYDMTTTVSEQVGISKNAYYYSSFVLGTVQGGINVKQSGNTCAAPEGYDSAVSDLDYCAINKFNFAALATGG